MDQRALKRAGRRALTVTKIEAMRPKDRRYEVTDSVARGLQLRIEPSGRKVWLHRYTWNDESIRLTLDDYEHLPLLEARARIKVNQDLLHRGIDPRSAQPPRRTSSKRPPPARLLPSPHRDHNPAGEPAQPIELAEVLPPGWPTDRQSLMLLKALTPLPTEKQHSVEFLIFEFFLLFIVPGRKDKGGVARILRVDVLAHWKDRDARTITPREIIQRLDAIVQRGARVMANRVAATLHQLFLHGVHRATIESSPVQLLFPPGGKEVSRTRALSNEEIGRFLAHRFEICPTEWLARALTILLLTAVRRGELCSAKWEHIDLGKPVWRIPAEHTKSGRAFLVYLTQRLVAEFSALKRLSRGSPYVLPHKALNDRPVLRNALTGSVYRSLWRFQLFGIALFTPHDLRRTCRTGMARIGIRRFVARRILNHKQLGMDGVYDLHESCSIRRSHGDAHGRKQPRVWPSDVELQDELRAMTRGRRHRNHLRRPSVGLRIRQMRR
jgi:integrase